MQPLEQAAIPETAQHQGGAFAVAGQEITAEGRQGKVPAGLGHLLKAAPASGLLQQGPGFRQPLLAQPLHRPMAEALLEGVLERTAAVAAALLHIGEADRFVQMGQQPLDQTLVHKGLGDQRSLHGRLVQIGQQQHHDQPEDQIVETEHRVDDAADGHAPLRIGHGLDQKVVQPITAGIGPPAEDGGLLQGGAKAEGIKTGTGDGMGHRQQAFRRETDDHTRAEAALELNAAAGLRNEQAGGAKGVGLSLNGERIQTSQIGEHELGLAFLLHLANNRGTPGGEQGEIAKA